MSARCFAGEVLAVQHMSRLPNRYKLRRIPGPFDKPFAYQDGVLDPKELLVIERVESHGIMEPLLEWNSRGSRPKTMSDAYCFPVCGDL